MIASASSEVGAIFFCAEIARGEVGIRHTKYRNYEITLFRALLPVGIGTVIIRTFRGGDGMDIAAKSLLIIGAVVYVLFGCALAVN